MKAAQMFDQENRYEKTHKIYSDMLQQKQNT